MKKTLRRFFAAALMAMAIVSCGKDGPIDPAKGDGSGNGDPGATPEYTVDKDGYATYTHQGFEFKLKAGVINTDDAKKAIQHMRSDLDYVVQCFPENALKILREHPIWLEENNPKNSSAAWCHTYYENGLTYGGLAAKGHCVEITNYRNYVAWANQNQPLMVLHELAHLYHALGLGGDSNVDINSAYNNAKNKGLYKTYYYRSTLSDTKGTAYQETSSQHAYCMTNAWEFFSEMSEAYWGENDYYPFNYMQLKELDPLAFAMMEKIWGKRF